MGNEPDFSRKILNANIGMINTIEKKDINDVMIKTFDKILDILSAHCGPYAEFAIIKDQAVEISEPTFTTDGVNIVSAIEFASPMEEFVRTMVKYIGQRTEMQASDGTTSSMVITIATLKYLLKWMQKQNITTTVPFSQFKKEYDEFQKIILDNLDKVKYTVDSLTEAIPDATRTEIIKAIAYNQAYTSSHGDIELSELVADMFVAIPEKAWQFVTFEREALEKEWDYKLIVEDSQVVMEAMITDKTMLNQELGTKYIAEDTDLITIAQPIISGTLQYNEMLIPAMKKAIEKDTSLAILIPARSDNQTKNELIELAKSHPNNKIAIFTKYLDNPEMNEVIISLLVRGISPLDVASTYKVHKHAKIKFANNKLELDNLYENPENSPIHPYTENPDIFPEYGQAMDTIVRVMENIRTQSPSAAGGERLQYYQKMFNALYLTKRATVRIGGKAHDNTAAVDKCMDTVGAVRETLRHGFTLGGCWSLWKALDIFLKEGIASDIMLDLAKSFKKSINDLHSITLGVGKKLAVPKSKEIPKLNEDTLYYDVIKQEGYMVFKPKYILNNDVPIQPASIDSTVIDRFGEVALKFIYTNRVVSPGTVYIEQKGKKNDNR